jgi:hypothetical protein
MIAMSTSRTCAPLAGRRFVVPMAGAHVRRDFDEWCLSS